MRRIVAAVGLLVALGAQPASAQNPIQIEPEVGIGGFITTDSANPVRVALTSDVLTVGSLKVTMGRSTLSTPIEVPAGTTKVYSLDFPPAERGGTTVVAVVDDRGKTVADVRTNARVPLEEIIAGVLGDAALVSAVDTAATVPFALDVAAVAIDDATLAGGFDVLDYLIMQRAPEVPVSDRVTRWVEDGGRLIGTAEAVAAVGLLPANGREQVVGAGVVNIDPLTATGEGALTLTAVPPASFIAGSGGEPSQLGSTLFEAASFGQQGEDLRFGWLVTALVLYVAVVGPVNFFVLARMNRRDWAWITVPVLSIAGMFAFWLVGGSDASSIDVRHASVVVQDRASIRAETGFVLAGGTEGEHRLAFSEAVTLTPFDAANWFGSGGRTETEIRIDERGRPEVAFELASLGVGSARASWAPASVGIRLEDDTIHNLTDWDFDRWGVRTAEGFAVSDGPLPAGGSAGLGPAVRVPEEVFSQSPIADAFFNRPFVEFDGSENSIWPLSWAATQLNEGLVLDGTYFFGFTDDVRLPVVADGSDQVATGRSLIVVETESGPITEPGSATAELVTAPGADWIEQYGPSFVYGADTVGVRFVVPNGSRQLTLTNAGGPGLGQLERIEVYDWQAGAFVAIEEREPFPSGPYTSPAGEVMMQLIAGGFETEVMVNALRLEWEAA